MISNIADIYDLKFEDIASLKKNGKKFAQNLIDSINISKQNDLYRLITALGIRHVGVKAAKVLAKTYENMDNLSNASIEDLSQVDEVGPIVANSINEFFSQEQTKDLLKRLKDAGVNMERQKEEKWRWQICRKNFCINKFPGPRFHVAGNHDFDKISLEDFLAHTENSDEMKGLTHYAFTKGGIKYIVLDACYNTMAGEHYSDGNLKWSVSMVPDFEVEWLRKVLAEGSEPVIVFIHQLLNFWDSSHGKIAGKIPDGYFIRNAAEVVDVLEQSRRVLAVFSGHYHSGWYSERRGIHYIVGKGMVENDAAHNAAGVVKIDKNLNIFIEGLEDEPSRNLTKSAFTSL